MINFDFDAFYIGIVMGAIPAFIAGMIFADIVWKRFLKKKHKLLFN